jgi:hypothetical protein
VLDEEDNYGILPSEHRRVVSQGSSSSIESWRLGLAAERPRSPAGARATRAPGPVHCEVRRPMIPADSITVGYCMTSSARSNNESGMVSPSALAVLRLITRSNFVGCSTGRSPGFVPLRILST